MKESLEKLLQSYIDSYLNNGDQANGSQQLPSDMGSPDKGSIGEEDEHALDRNEDDQDQENDENQSEQNNNNNNYESNDSH